MKLTCARFGGDIQHAAGVTEFGAVFALQNLKFLERVDGGLDQCSALVMVGNIGAIEKEGELVSFHPADGCARFVIGANSQQVPRAWQQGSAWRHSRQLVKAAG